MIFRYFIFALIIYIINGEYEPTEYSLAIAVDLNARRFEGSVNITIDVKQSTIRRIVLDADDSLSVSCVNFVKNSTEFITHTCAWTPQGLFAIHFPFLLEPDVYVATFKFILIEQYKLFDAPHKGLHFFDYNEGDEEKIVAVTQLQPNMAKYVFPCFMNPKYRTKFNIVIRHKINEYALSNGEFISTSDLKSGWMETSFSYTKILSASMISFVVHSFSNSVKHSVEPITIYGRKEALPYALPMLETIKDTLEYFISKRQHVATGIIKKLDIVLLPNYNINTEISYQLILTREQNININNVTSLDSLYYQTIGIIKMIAKQWYGIYTAPNVIDDIWIYDAIVKYLAYFVITAIEEHWTGFQDDILQNQELLENVIINNTEEKGVAIIKMYELRHAQLSTILDNGPKQAELFELYITIMQIWGRSTNSFPLLTAFVNKNKTLIVDKKQFIYDENNNKLLPEDTRPAPLECFLYNTSLHLLNLNEFSEQQTFLLCHSKLTPCVINYNVNNWEQITNVLLDHNNENRKLFNGYIRAQIYDHAFKLARAGLIDYKIPLNLSQALKYENETAPIKILMKHLDYIETMYNFNEDMHLFKKYYISLLEPHYEQLKFDDKIAFYSHDIIKKICHLGLRSCVTNSITVMNEWRALFYDNESTVMNIEESIRPIVYCTAVRFGSESIWRFVYQRYTDKKRQIPLENNNLLNALGCRDNGILINKYLDITVPFSDDRHDSILKNDHIVHSSVHNSNYGRHILLNYIRENAEKVKRKWGLDLTRKEILKIIRKTTTNCFLLDIERFILTTDFTNDEITSALKDASTLINSRDRHIKEIRKWLTGAPYVNINIRPYQDPNYSFKLINTINTIKSRYSMKSSPRTSFNTDLFLPFESEL